MKKKEKKLVLLNFRVDQKTFNEIKKHNIHVSLVCRKSLMEEIKKRSKE